MIMSSDTGNMMQKPHEGSSYTGTPQKDPFSQDLHERHKDVLAEVLLGKHFEWILRCLLTVGMGSVTGLDRAISGSDLSNVSNFYLFLFAVRFWIVQ